jgi:hypothetical protein
LLFRQCVIRLFSFGHWSAGLGHQVFFILIEAGLQSWSGQAKLSSYILINLCKSLALSKIYCFINSLHVWLDCVAAINKSREILLEVNIFVADSCIIRRLN